MDAGRPQRIVVLSHPDMDAHQATGHPERPDRRLAAIAGVDDAAAARGCCVDRPVIEEAARIDLERVHLAQYLDGLASAEAAGGGWLDPDTYLAPGSGRAARLGSAAALEGARRCAHGLADVAVAAVRPPGHHAFPGRAGGFCLLNHVALAARWLRQSGEADRVAIVDWDVHHGDGTAATFAADPSVAYASTHQWGLFPGTGAADDRGEAGGVGTTWNVPLPAGAGDDTFVDAWRDQLLPALAAFEPQAVLVSAGFDAHRDDPLAGLEVSEQGFHAVARGVGELASASGVRGVTVVLEGGYDLAAVRAGMSATVVGILDGMSGSR